MAIEPVWFMNDRLWSSIPNRTDYHISHSMQWRSCYVNIASSTGKIVGTTHKALHLLQETDHIFIYLLMLSIVMGLPLSGFDQFIDKGDYVEVKKRTKLCSKVQRGSNHPRRQFRMVTSIMRSNRTQTVEGFVQCRNLSIAHLHFRRIKKLSRSRS
jgi:hypothetical protein